MRRALLLLFALALIAAAQAQVPFYLHDGDRVVFYGDSITDQRLYTTFVESYAVTRFPEMKVSFVHSGWGGDRVSGGGGGPVDVRLWRDVYAYKPTVITVMLGMNDGKYRAFDQTIFDDFANGYRHIVQSVKSSLPGVRMTLIQPSPYDDVTRAPNFDGGYNQVLVRYGDFIKELASKESLDAADMNAYVVAALAKAKDLDTAKAADLIKDRVHPGAGGHLLMAAALLKAWNAPAIVSSAELDASRGALKGETTSAISGFEHAGGAVRRKQLDAALPMPLDLKDPAVALALRSSDFVELDRQMLRVSGLTAPSYRLRIDGTDAGTFSREQLAAGVNLAAMDTPMLRQALAVHDLTLKHNNIHFARWRQVQVPLEREELERKAAAMAALDGLENERHRASSGTWRNRGRTVSS